MVEFDSNGPDGVASESRGSPGTTSDSRVVTGIDFFLAILTKARGVFQMVLRIGYDCSRRG